MGLISVIASIAKKSSPDDTALSQLPPANAKRSPLPQLFQQIHSLNPTTATIFAEFSNRTPAIALNKLGKGVFLLLNWHAEHEIPPAVGETVKRAMSQWTSGGQKVYITTTTANRDQYGARSMDAATISLWRLGYRPKVAGAGQPRGTGFQPVKTRPGCLATRFQTTPPVHRARGNMYFSLHYLNEPLIDVFRTEFYPSKAPAH